MKSFKNILAAIAIVAVFSVNSFAQSTADVDVTATVNAALVLTPTAVALGSIQQAASILPANGNDVLVSTNVGTGASTGSLQIQGTSAASVNVTFGTANLTNGTPGEDVTFTPSVYLSSTAVASGDDVTITGGDITLDVGGSLAAPTGTGSYSTSGGTGSPITFTVQYN